MMRIFCSVLFCALLTAQLPTYPAFAAMTETTAAVAPLDFSRGQQLFQSGDLQRSLAVLRAYVQQYPEHAQVSQAYTLIGRIFIEQQRYPDALLYLARIPAQVRSPEANLLTGYSLIQTEAYQAGQDLLLELIDFSFHPKDQQRLILSLATAAENLQQPLQALVFLQQALLLVDSPAALLERVHQLLQVRLSDNELAEAAFMWQGTAIGQDARLQLARRALAQQQQEKARLLLQQVLASAVTFPYFQEAEMLLQRSSIESWFNRDYVGVLLPLSGRYASYGELLQKGFELALQQHNKTRLPVRFIYRDSADENVGPAQLVSSLADDDKVMAIIGPLFGLASEAAAKRAQLEMVPLLTLSQRNGLPQLGNFIFRDSLTAKMQVQSLARYAIDSQHISFSILHPENRLGNEMTRMFIDEVRQFGGEIVDIVSYPEGATDFREQIQTLLWEDHIVEAPEKPEDPAFVGPPIPAGLVEPVTLEYPLAPFHALFIPDYAERIGMLAPQLLFYGLKDVTLLGINGWNSPELVERAGRFLGQAVFVDGFFKDSRQPEVQRFVELYRQTYQDEPTILEAQAFDAANLLLRGMDNPKVVNRDDLRRVLASQTGFRGVTGTLGFDELGEALKQPYLLQVKRGRIVELP